MEHAHSTKVQAAPCHKPHTANVARTPDDVDDDVHPDTGRTVRPAILRDKAYASGRRDSRGTRLRGRCGQRRQKSVMSVAA